MKSEKTGPEETRQVRLSSRNNLSDYEGLRLEKITKVQTSTGRGHAFTIFMFEKGQVLFLKANPYNKDEIITTTRITCKEILKIGYPWISKKEVELAEKEAEAEKIRNDFHIIETALLSIDQIETSVKELASVIENKAKLYEETKRNIISRLQTDKLEFISKHGEHKFNALSKAEN